MRYLKFSIYNFIMEYWKIEKAIFGWKNLDMENLN